MITTIFAEEARVGDVVVKGEHRFTIAKMHAYTERVEFVFTEGTETYESVLYPRRTRLTIEEPTPAR